MEAADCTVIYKGTLKKQQMRSFASTATILPARLFHSSSTQHQLGAFLMGLYVMGERSANKDRFFRP